MTVGAKVEVIEGPSVITREWGQRRVSVTSNVRGRDIVGFVDEAQRRKREDLEAAAVREDRLIPVHELVEAAGGADDLATWARGLRQLGHDVGIRVRLSGGEYTQLPHYKPLEVTLA